MSATKASSCVSTLCWVVFLLLLGFWGGGALGASNSSEGQQQAANFISWNDMKLHPNRRINGQDFGADGSDNRTRVIVVDWNGTRGDVTSVQAALEMVPPHNTQRVKIYIYPGIYREKVIVQRSKPYISFIGQENKTSETVITWNNKASDKDENGNEIGTYRSASVLIESNYFCATGITFENSMVPVPGGNGNQAVALRIAGDKAMFYRVRVLGSQDTLLDERGTHYFYQCHIQGTVDFIFGQARSLYQDCVLQSTAKGYGAIAAHHRNDPNEDSGFSFVNCVINGTGNVYLGRAWGNYSRAIYSYCSIEDIIVHGAWSDWNDPARQKTVEFGTYQCRGEGANTSSWVPWSKSFTFKEASPYLNRSFIEGDTWLRL